MKGELHDAVASDGFVLGDVIVYELLLNDDVALSRKGSTASRA